MNIKSCQIGDGNYPRALRFEKNAPRTLYFAGDVSVCDLTVIAVIGKREATTASMQAAERVGRLLAREGFAVLNGLAIGVDASAAEGALRENGKVIAVMPGGLDEIHPKSNQGLAERILENGGCLISEYPCGVRPQKLFFVQRDRIQAMLSEKVLVVEADLGGGTMHTVEQALRRGKPLGCVDLPSAGNQMLIKAGKATAVTNAKVLLDFARAQESSQISLFDHFGLS